jgi:hypothetical protein
MNLSRRKIFELFILLIFSYVFYSFIPQADEVSLFIFGYIWNWSTSIEMDSFNQNRRYRFSMLRVVFNFQNFIMKPFMNSSEVLRHVIKVFPAGIFWMAVIYINESSMPWWIAFSGSFTYELLQLRLFFYKGLKKIV